MNDKKRTKNALSLSQKVDIISKLERGIKAKSIAQEYEVSESAISYIKGQKSKIMEAAASTSHDAQKKNITHFI